MSSNENCMVLRPRKLEKILPEDEIVISGIAGRFPDSDNIQQLQQNLFNKVDLVSDDDRRWKVDHPEIPQRTGKVNNLDKFDALFFGVHSKQGHSMDPMARTVLEHAYEAIIDAGYNPRQMRNTRTGVFIASCMSESETRLIEEIKDSGFGLIGANRAMYANRVSYFFDFKGPSIALDSACSASFSAVDQGYRAIREGLCDAAIVGGCSLCLQPTVSRQFFLLGVLSSDGRSKTFDEHADGYARSETIGVMLLQKARDARRIYGTLVHVKSNCDGYKVEGITFPSSSAQTLLLNEFYAECGVFPKDVNYVEAHGTGTKVGDPEELNSIDSVFGKTRTRDEPLLVGSVKSNLGHSEGASGMCQLAKAVIAMEAGIIPPNLHFNHPRLGFKAFEEGRVKIVTEPTPWKGGYMGLSSFGFGGANVHILLKSNPKEKINAGVPSDDLPRLVAVSGRTEDAVSVILTDLEGKPVDVEYVKLLHDIHSEEIKGHIYRGYTLLPSHGVNDSPTRNIQEFSGAKRPIWFVFSGMGSQWPGMGEALLRLPVFAEAIRKCDAALKPHGLDIFHIISNTEKNAFDNILYSFVGIAAIQIGLVDILHSVGIEPDNIIGHSVGELGCAYADGCFTAEEMILSAYSRGMASIETKVIYGSMAAVGLGYEKLKDLCPADIEIACHNSNESATISGPAESMTAFVAELQAKNIFAREVPCSNIPYHSRYIAPAGPKLLAYLQKVISNPKPRSAKWLSTSVPSDKWDTPLARLSSAEYHTNNLLSPVLFEETSVNIPKDAVTIEISPHGLLQAILRRSLNSGVTNIPLTQRGNKDNLHFFLQALGKMYNAGIQPQLANLYPRVEYPVSRTTQMISPMIKWEHSDSWFVDTSYTNPLFTSGERTIKVSLTFNAFKSMAGHVIDGRNLFPATGYLLLTWKTLAKTLLTTYYKLPVVFEDVKFLRATNIPKKGSVLFTVMVHKGSGRFEVVEGKMVVVTGTIRVCPNPDGEKMQININEDNGEEEEMTSRDVYKELRLRGYQYTDLFKSIKSSTISGSRGHITWHNDWCAFIDNMLQMVLLREDTRSLFVPVGIKKLVIDTKSHYGYIQGHDKEFDFPVYTNKILDVIVSGGVEIRGLNAGAISRRKPAGDPVLEEYKFVPHIDEADLNLPEIAKLASNICLENNLGIKVKTIEFIEETNQIPCENLLSPWISESLGDIPLIQAEVGILCANNYFEDGALPDNVSVIDPKKLNADANAILAVGHRLLTNDCEDNLNLLLRELKAGGLILTRENVKESKNIEVVAESKGFHVIVVKKSGDELFILLRKQINLPEKSSIVHVTNENFDWVETMKKILKEELEKKADESTRIYFVGEGDFENGLMGLVNCLRQEPGGEVVRGILIQDPRAPKFSLQNPFYAKQIRKDLAVCCLRDKGVWGTYRHVLLALPEPKPVSYAYLNQDVRGDLSSFKWFEGVLPPTYDNDHLVRIFYSSINFKDVMLSTGKLPVEAVVTDRKAQECVIGFEFTGITMSGKRVMGVMDNRTFANFCICDSILTWKIPDHWTLEDAATVPCVYSTCYYALYINGNMRKGDKVLIHSGTGGIGQSAINLALHEGCEVFTTVGTPEKRRFILEHFPQISEDHIGNSRDTSFEQMIMKVTKGKGVDIVLNSLAEEKLQASVRCLGHGGRFLEIGKFDLQANNTLGMSPFLNEISFKGVMLDILAANTNSKKSIEIKAQLEKLMRDGIKNGAVKPLHRTVFKKDQIEPAFRYMAAGKHIGKVVVKIRNEKDLLDKPILAHSRYNSLSNSSYIILGGLGGFGLELADWLILRGAKNIVLTSRTGVKNGYQKLRINVWRSYGTQVVIIAGKDASKREDCQFIIETANKLGPVDGIFNLAVVLKDSLWENQSPASFEESFHSKALATKQLDVLTRKLCPELRHFVVFSSVTCGRGNAGQTNYGMSNSVMERICEKRASKGLPGLAIQWGAIGDVGLVADMQENNKELIIGGTLQQGISSCLKILEQFLLQSKPIVSSMVVAEKRSLASGANMNIIDTVLSIMGLKDLKGISLNVTLAELGMDSMMAVEIKQTLEREFDVFLTAQDIRCLNFAKLHEMSDPNSDRSKKADSKVSSEANELVGMQVFVRVIGNDDIKPEICLRLQSKQTVSGGEIFLIPGIEGVASVFSTLASNLKLPAICLQLGINNNGQQSIFDMADYLFPHMFEICKGQQKFTIVGYSFGAIIAIELARRLETEGKSGRLILIDGAPVQLKGMMNPLTSKTNNIEEFQNNMLISLVSMEPRYNALEIGAEIQKYKTWNEKLDLLTKYCTDVSKLPLSIENQKTLYTTLYKRLLAVQSYDSSQLRPIKTPILLLKPTFSSFRGDNEDYNLSKMTNGEIEIQYVEGNHLTMLDNSKVASIINEGHTEVSQNQHQEKVKKP